MTNKKRPYKLQGGLMVPTTKLEVVPEEKLKIKSVIPRKTITIYKSEYDEWVKIKGEGHSWTSLLKTVREGHQFFKQVMANLTVKVQSGGYNHESVGIPIKRKVSSGRVPIVKPNSPKALVLKEIKKATEGDMTIEEFRESLLKPLTEKELENIQKSDEELVQAQNKSICLEDLKPPK